MENVKRISDYINQNIDGVTIEKWNRVVEDKKQTKDLNY